MRIYSALIDLGILEKTVRKVSMVDFGETFSSKSKKCLLYIFHVVKNVFQNPTRCKNFNLESDKLEIFSFNSDQL